MTTGTVNALEVRGLSKTFGAFRALKDFSFDIQAGEIHALVGENGCGKSTTVKCLSGYHTPDPGAEIVVGGQPLQTPFGPDQVGAAGMSFVHQDIGLIPSLSVVANLSLGHPARTGFGWRLRERAEIEEARELLGRLGHDNIDPRALVKDLSVAARTVVAIARCLRSANAAKLLVLDEPTAALPRPDIARLFAAFRRAAAQGLGILYISHHLDEIFEVCDRVTVLRDGAKVATESTSQITQNELVGLMIGRSTDAFYPQVETTVREDVVLRGDRLSGNRVQEVSLSLHRGEIAGVAGLLGSGKSELGRLLFGSQRLTSGTVERDGRPLKLRSAADGIRAGIAMVPANRRRDGVFMLETLTDNVTFPDLADQNILARVPRRRRRALTESLLKSFTVRPADPNRLFALLSGGNQQKAVLAKWMHREPAILVLDEPTQGIDIGAKAQVYRLLEQAAADGMALIIISEEFEDLAHLCDRVLIMRAGRIVAELQGDALTGENVSAVVYQEASAA